MHVDTEEMKLSRLHYHAVLNGFRHPTKGESYTQYKIAWEAFGKKRWNIVTSDGKPLPESRWGPTQNINWKEASRIVGCEILSSGLYTAGDVDYPTEKNGRPDVASYLHIEEVEQDHH